MGGDGEVSLSLATQTRRQEGLDLSVDNTLEWRPPGQQQKGSSGVKLWAANSTTWPTSDDCPLPALKRNEPKSDF